MIVLKTNYEKNIDNGWIFKENICNEAEYITLNSNRGHFAKFKLLFEVYQGSSEPVIFEDLAELQEDLKGIREFEEFFKLITNRIIITIEEYLEDMYLKGHPIINLKITLSDLLIDEFASVETSYRMATEILLRKLFSSDILIKANK